MDSQTITQSADQQLQIPADTRVYLENLLEDAGMMLTPELKESLIIDLYNRLEKKMIADAIENMKPEDVEVFVQTIKTSQNQQEIDQFINSHLPNAKEIFVQSLVDFRTYFLGGTIQGNSANENISPETPNPPQP